VALRHRQQRFVEEYLIDLNATQAARRAGYSADTARQMGAENLSKPVIQAAIADAMRERSLRCKMTADEVLLRLARLGRANMQDYAEWGPAGVTLKDSAVMPLEAADCVAEVSQTISKDGGSLKFKLHDKVRALELCGKHLGLFPDRLHVEGNVQLEIAEVVVRTRAEAQETLRAMAQANGVPVNNGRH
jgi:phage terminase small subunit